MIVKNKKSFGLGIVLAISFFAVFLLMFSPLFKGKTGLQFADDIFNKLAKGSSYFIPNVSSSVGQFVDTPLSISIRLDKPEDAEGIAKLLTAADARIDIKDSELKVEGDLGVILQNALKDAESMYKNDGKAVLERYGYDEKKAIKNWWYVLSSMEKGLKKNKLIAEAKIVSDVTKKAIEPAYNFYQIDAKRVSDHAGMMSGLLVFYVLYTMWWGYAIFYICEGVGCSLKKAKVKKEI